MLNKCPLVSVITPVYNEELYLRECIESVLAQTYTKWDYTIVDNCSTDKTLAIAHEYANKDPRIRVYSNAIFVRAVENQNIALNYVSPESKYTKLVFADDYLFPECIDRMVNVAEQYPSIAVVGAYGIGVNGTRVVWDGLPYPSTFSLGRTIGRGSLLGEYYVFGTATSLLYRSSLVRKRQPFLNESNLHADSEVCYDLLSEYDFGFVHQILTYSRTKAGSLSSFSEQFNTYLPNSLYILKEYGMHYLSSEEIEAEIAKLLRRYYRYLAREVYRNRGRSFWKFHREKLASVGYRLNTLRLVISAGLCVLDRILNPKDTFEKLFRG